eukprot:TRINITY_DN7481_c0_g1_i1.p1 TRINITY_DN7481_c0_g1~~TRINITY_DN7481_c0_g1_i1.p1  ORF type:complete len:565 (+),score=148.00 TRINITY_DN7481_c0_g1_i1:92-1786(+)
MASREASCSMVEGLRSRVIEELSACNTVTAIFLADQLTHLSDYQLDDVILLVRALAGNGEHARALTLLRKRRLMRASPECKLLATRCMLELGQHEEVLEFVGEYPEVSLRDDVIEEEADGVEGDEKDAASVCASTKKGNTVRSALAHGDGHTDAAASLKFTKRQKSTVLVMAGTAYLLLDHRGKASKCLLDALLLDPCCFHAFQLLSEHRMLTAIQEKELKEKLLQANGEVEQYIATLYSSLTDTPQTQAECNSMWHRGMRASKMLEFGQFEAAEKLCHSSNEENPDFDRTLSLVLVACYVHTKKRNELFRLAHSLVDAHPKNCVSWYAVGCYYLVLGEKESAQKYLNKCTSMNGQFAEGWLVYGHAFSTQQEHDQAMASYRVALRCAPGSHVPPLCIGMELLRVKQLHIAAQYLRRSLDASPTDPFALNEMGVVHFEQEKYEGAENCFAAAIEQLEGRNTDYSEGMCGANESSLASFSVNLAHTLRKQRRYNKAIAAYQRALCSSAEHRSIAHGGIGMCLHLEGQLEKAVDHYHMSLAIDRCEVTQVMLTHALDELMLESLPW